MSNEKHIWEFDLKKHGNHGIRKLNPDTGKEDIRTKDIPTMSTFAQRIAKLFDKGKKK